MEAVQQTFSHLIYLFILFLFIFCHHPAVKVSKGTCVQWTSVTHYFSHAGISFWQTVV